MSDDYDIDIDGDDDLDLDGLDFGGDDFDFGIDEPVDDRKPVVKVAAGFGEAVKDSLTNPRFVGDIAKRALPSAYGNALDEVDRMASSFEAFSSKTAADLAPELNRLKKGMQRAIPTVERFMPKSMADKVKKWSESSQSDDFGGSYKAPTRDELIGNQVNEIFAGARKDDTAQQMLDIARSEDQHKQNMTINQASMSGIGRLVEYQDTVTSNYQRKSLELQLRHFYTAKDLLEISGKGYDAIQGALSVIVKNTALPDAQKIKMSETGSQVFKEQLFGKLYGGAADSVVGFKERLFSGIGEKARGMAEGFKDGLTQANDAMEMTGDVEGLDKDKLAGQVLGGAAADQMGRIASRWLANQEFFGRNEDVVRYGGVIQDVLRNKDEYLIDAIDNLAAREGMAGTFGNFLRETAGDNRRVESIAHNLSEKGTDVVNWDLMSRRSLVEIIPGYLSRIHQSMEGLRTGELSDRLVYNAQQEDFTTLADAARDVNILIDSVSNKRSRSEYLQTLVDKIDPSNELDAMLRAKLAKQLLADNRNRIKYDPKRYASPESYGEIEQVGDRIALAEFFRTRFKLEQDYDGGYDYMDRNAKNASLDHLGDTSGIRERLRSLDPNIELRANMIAALGGKDALRRAGIVTKDSMGIRDIVNDRGIFESIYNETDIAESVYGEQDERFADPDIANRRPTVGGRPPLPPAAGNSDTGFGREGVRLLGDLNQQLVSLNQLIAGMPRNISEQTLRVELPEMQEIDWDPVLTRMDEGLGLSKNTDTNVAEILATMKAYGPWMPPGGGFGPGAGGGGGPAPQGGLTAQLIDSAKELGWKALRGASTLTGGYYRTLWNVGGTALRMARGHMPGAMGVARNTLRKAKSWVSGRAETVDAYIRGMETPALLASKLKAGEYFDAVSGKVIRSLDDIVGDVVDAQGNVVLTAEQALQGLYDRSGERLKLQSESVLNAARKAAGYVTGFYGKIFGAGGSMFDKLRNLTMDVANLTTGLLQDAYVMGDDRPRIYKTKLLKGFYFNLGESKPLRSLADIKGAVMDADGNIVISEEELEKGLYSAHGEKIKLGRLSGLISKMTDVGGLAGGVVGVAKAGVTGYFKFLQTLAQGGADVLKKLLPGSLGAGVDNAVIQAKLANITIDEEAIIRMAGLDNGTLTRNLSTADAANDANRIILPRAVGAGIVPLSTSSTIERTSGDYGQGTSEEEKQTNHLSKLVALMEERFPKKVAGDTDGDGHREGSWRDILNDRMRAKKNAVMDALRSRGKGTTAAIGGALGAITGAANDDDGDGGGSLLGDIATEAAGEVIGDRLTRRGGRGGIARRGLGAIRGAGGRLLGLGARGAALLAGTGMMTGLGTAATTAITGAGSAIAAAGGALASAISLPVVLGAAAVGGAGYLGYKGVKALSYRADAEPLEAMRFNQYGLDVTKGSHLAAARYLEDELEDSYTGTGFDADVTEMAREVAGDFDVDADNPDQLAALIVYLKRRFIPMWLQHKRYLEGVDSSVDLDDVDDELDSTLKVKYANEMAKKGAGILADQVKSPFPGGALVKADPSYLQAIVDEFGTVEEKATSASKSKAGAAAAVLGVAAGAAVAPGDIKDKLPKISPATDVLPAAAMVAGVVHGSTNDELWNDIMEEGGNAAPAAVEPTNPLTPPRLRIDPTELTSGRLQAMERSIDRVREAEVKKTSIAEQQTSLSRHITAGRTNEIADIMTHQLNVQLSMDDSLKEINKGIGTLVERMSGKGIGEVDVLEEYSERQKRAKEARLKAVTAAKQRAVELKNASKPVTVSSPVSMAKGTSM